VTPARLAAAALATFLALAPTITSTSYADDPTPAPTTSPSPNDDSPAQIIVTKLAPRAPMDPQEFFQVRGILINRGSQTLHGLTVRLRRGEKLSSRSELATADDEPPATPTRVGRTPVRALQQDLPPGAKTEFDIRIRVSQLRMTGPRAGVYPLRVEARGTFGDSGAVDTLGSVPTYVPWFPDGPPHGRIRIAWLWPVVDQPRRGPREVMLDDELSTSLAHGGRLDRMVRSAASGQQGGCDAPPDGPTTLPPRPRTTPCRGDSVPVTYAVDPDLLFTADALGSPYQLLQNGKTKRIDNTAPARSWMAALRDAVDAPGNDVLSLPYGDPDAVALTAPQNGLADEVPLLRELGRKVTTKILKAPMTSVVWPPAGRLTRRSVESLTSGGGTALVVDPIALPEPDSEPSYTPDALIGQLPTNTGQPSVLTIDPALSALLTPTYDDYPGDRIVEQRWLAETAMISAERPSISRTILVAPPRRADLHTAVAADAIRDTGRLPWLCGVSLASLGAGTATCPDEVRGNPDSDSPPVELEPPHPGDTFLSTDFLRRVRLVRGDSTQFTDEVLAEPTSTDAVGTTSRLLRARARTESSAWREHADDGEQVLKLLHDDLADLRKKVHLQVGSGAVTLTSSSGVISVNVVNELQQPVRVGVVLNAFNRARLSTRETPVTLVPAEQATQINIKVTAQTSGQFPVRAQLVDREGNAFGDHKDLVVRSTQYGRVALAVTGLGAGVLLVAAGFRIVRRAVRGTARRGTT
jgi:hypothetical protein